MNEGREDQTKRSAEHRSHRSGLSGFAFVLLLLLLVLQVLAFFISPRRSAAIGSALAPQRQRALAVRLENANLPSEAADAWMTYLEMAPLGDEEVAGIRVRVAQLMEDSGDFRRAIGQYYLAEEVLGEQNAELQETIDNGVRECFSRLGDFATLMREIAAREAGGEGEPAVGANQKIVARIGGESLTLTDFERLLNAEVEASIRSRPGLTTAEVDVLRRRAYEQLRDRQVQARYLRRIVERRVLARQAREEGLHRSEEFRRRIMAAADGILENVLLDEEVEKRAAITPEDVRRFYEANQDRYVEPAATFIAHIQVRTEAQAQQVIERIYRGESFDEIARRESLDESTRRQFGIVTEPVAANGTYVPLFGDSSGLHERIEAAEPGSVLEHPARSDDGWHVVKIISRRQRQERPFEEIREQVRLDVRAARRREVTEAYIQELFDKIGVALFPEVLLAEPASGGGAGGDQSGAAVTIPKDTP